MVKSRYKNNSSESRGFQGIMIFAGQLRCYCLNFNDSYVCESYFTESALTESTATESTTVVSESF